MPVCADRCANLPRCISGSASCGGHSVSISGTTVHVTDCRGIASGAGGGAISYCIQDPIGTPVPPTPPPTPPPCTNAWPSPCAGKIIGRCIGWPNPHVEIRWSSFPPPGQGAKNANSIKRGPPGGLHTWFYAGGWPGVWATRISGAQANPWGTGGYPAINYSVYDLRDDGVQIGQSYEYIAKYRADLPSSNTYSVTVNASSCGGATATPSPAPTPSIAPGSIVGSCRWVSGAPEVRLAWSAAPPPNQGAATTNIIEKGDSYPPDPAQYWGQVFSTPAVFSFGDTAVSLNTQYQYRVKYRPDLPSVNSYSIFVSAANCGGPAPTPGPLGISPSFQTLPPGLTAFLSATGGDGTYTWDVGDGTLSGSGPTVGVVFTNALTTPVQKTVRVTSGGQSRAATVQVDGVSTFQDDIDLTGQGGRFVLINGGDDYAYSPDTTLTLGHGFTTEATSSVVVRLSRTLEGLATVPAQPFAKQVPWNLCDSSQCPEGQYTVYAGYSVGAGLSTRTVLDNIVHLAAPAGLAAVSINRGGATTSERQVELTLAHGIAGAPDDEVTMQIANTADGVTDAVPVPFSSLLGIWDVCDGLGLVCGNGIKTVFVRFCRGSECTATVQDTISLNSPWPAWGIRINDDEPSTGSGTVTLSLNPWFNLSGTQIYLSNFPDLLDALPQPFASAIPWDMCAGKPLPCSAGDYEVFAFFVNASAPSWPTADSPKYQDAIALTVATPTPTPTPEPAAILINDGTATTTSRTVELTFSSPFGTSGVTMRPVNEGELSLPDRVVIEERYDGGVPSQPAGIAPEPLRTQSVSDNDPAKSTPGAAPTQDQRPSDVPPDGGPTRNTLMVIDDGTATAELTSGTERPFVSELQSWDLCAGEAECPYGIYKVYVQFYHESVARVPAGRTLAAMISQVSQVYVDSIVYAAPTPAPSGSAVPSPLISGSPVPSGSVQPPPPWVPGVVLNIAGAFSGALGPAAPVVGPLAFASAMAVAASAIAALSVVAIPGAMAFAWQSFMGALGLLPKRKKVWGTVYDASTKRPIPFAKVQLLDRAKRVLETRIADREGRYGFLTTPESLLAQNVQIQVAPVAPGYLFPSRTPPSVDSFVYGNVYYGEPITVKSDTLINFDVPMDPVNPAHGPLVVQSPSIALGASVAAIADAGFWLGMVMVPLAFVLNPNAFTLGTAFLFLGTASLRIWGISEHPFGTVSDMKTGTPMPFALITLNDLSGKRIGFAVSDEQGRYFIVAPKGAYELAAFTPATVVPPRQFRGRVDIKKGWLTRPIAF